MIVGSPGRGSGVTSLWMVEDLEDVRHEATEGSTRLVNVAHQRDLALVDPDAMTFRAGVDFHALEITLDEVTAALRALHIVLATLDLTTLLVEERAHLLDQLRILAGKVLVLIPSWMVIRVPMHLPPLPVLRQFSCGGLLASESVFVESAGFAE